MVDKGEGERPGSHHYRAFVGPAEDYDVLGGLQFSLLFALGLREHHTLCDVGCGSLRAGRLLLTYLEPGHYHGLEPEEWTVKDAIEQELGRELIDRRAPVFRFTADYGVSSFGIPFDFVLAQSIFSHTFADDAATLLGEIAAGLTADGLLVGTYYPVVEETDHPLPRASMGRGWRYPGNVAYEWPELVDLAGDAGLTVEHLAWPHPRQRWFLAARTDGPVDVTSMARRVQPPIDHPGEEATGPNAYYERRFGRSALERGDHRAFVGGSWQRMGGLQLRYLRDQGLRRSDRLLDIGCGALRAGIRFVRYLEPDHYYGIDVNPDLLRAGLEIELPAAGLEDRLSADHLLCDDRFSVDRFGQRFDVALAQSVFTHLPLNHIRLCLSRTAGVMAPGGRFFATFFRCPDDRPTDQPLRHVKTVTYPDRDPFHYRVSDFEWAVRDLPFRLHHVGEWGHPFGQEMLRFDFEG